MATPTIAPVQHFITQGLDGSNHHFMQDSNGNWVHMQSSAGLNVNPTFEATKKVQQYYNGQPAGFANVPLNYQSQTLKQASKSNAKLLQIPSGGYFGQTWWIKNSQGKVTGSGVIA